MIYLNPTMHKNQKLRLIQQICFMLKLSQPATSTVLQYYHKFSQAGTGNEYANEVVVCSCIFLVSKIFEDQRKIRDILNTINSAIKLYQLARANEGDDDDDHQLGDKKQSNYIYLAKVVDGMDRGELLAAIQPNYELTMYNQLKKKVLQAEQLLLKIIKFDFSLAEQKRSNFKQLLCVCDQMRLPRKVIQTAINVYNDMEFCENVMMWVPGIVYFAVTVVMVEEKGQGQSRKNITLQNSKSGEGEMIDIKESEGQGKLPQMISKKSKPQKQLLSVSLQKIDWQKLFLVSIKKFQVHSEKIVEYYQKISQEQYQTQQEEAQH